eukprot:4734596-Prymnesium_polylepis.1
MDGCAGTWSFGRPPYTCEECGARVQKQAGGVMPGMRRASGRQGAGRGAIPGGSTAPASTWVASRTRNPERSSSQTDSTHRPHLLGLSETRLITRAHTLHVGGSAQGFNPQLNP